MATQAIDFSDLGGKQVSPPPAAAIDFSDLGGKQVQAPPTAQQPIESAPSKVTGISAPAGDTVNVGGVQFPRSSQDTGYKVDKWLQSVKNDINNGTDETGIGKVFKSMGAHGLNTGGPQDFLPNVTKMATFLFGGPSSFEEPAAAAANAIPSTARAGDTLKNLITDIGDKPVAITNRLKDALDDIKDLSEYGRPLPPVANKFMDRLANTDNGALTFKEGRGFESALAEKLSANESMNLRPSMQRALGEFKLALRETMSDTAADAGRLDDYQRGLKEYASGSNLNQNIEGVKENAAKVAKNVPWWLARGATEGAGGYSVYNWLRKMFQPN